MMRPLTELNNEASEIQLKIRKLLLTDHNFDDAIADKLTAISTITQLRIKLAALQREIRERSPE